MNPLTDPGVTFAVLRAIAACVAVERARYRPTRLSGAAEIGRLRTLSIQDLHRLAALRPAVACVQIDPAALRRGLFVLADTKRLVRLRNQFIRKGASPTLMRVLFKLDEKVTRTLRRQLNVTSRWGRPKLPTRAIRNAMHACWYGLADSDPRERYLALERKFPGWPLDTLYLVVCEAEHGRAKASGADRATAGEMPERSTTGVPRRSRVRRERRT